jgi:hypothetical protein
VSGEDEAMLSVPSTSGLVTGFVSVPRRVSSYRVEARDLRVMLRFSMSMEVGEEDSSRALSARPLTVILISRRQTFISSK